MLPFGQDRAHAIALVLAHPILRFDIRNTYNHGNSRFGRETVGELLRRGYDFCNHEYRTRTARGFLSPSVDVETKIPLSRHIRVLLVDIHSHPLEDIVKLPDQYV